MNKYRVVFSGFCGGRGGGRGGGRKSGLVRGTCWHCLKPGHHKAECWHWKRARTEQQQQQEQAAAPNAEANLATLRTSWVRPALLSDSHSPPALEGLHLMHGCWTLVQRSTCGMACPGSTQFPPLPHGHVKVGNGVRLPVKGVGTLCIQHDGADLQFPNVMFAPGDSGEPFVGTQAVRRRLQAAVCPVHGHVVPRRQSSCTCACTAWPVHFC